MEVAAYPNQWCIVESTLLRPIFAKEVARAAKERKGIVLHGLVLERVRTVCFRKT